MAERPRVPRRLRRLAVPLQAVRHRPDRRRQEASPLVYFGSFQDLLGKDKSGNIKAKNTWLHEINWDLVVFDEYHFGAWRDNAKELFEGEDDAEAKKETKLEFNPELDGFNEELDELQRERDRVPPHHHQGLPLPLRHALQGARHGRVHRGADLQLDLHRRAAGQAELRPKAFPDKWNPYAALPEMRLLTYQMPDELLAIASQGEFDEFDLNEFFAATGSGERGDLQAQERRAEVARHHPRRLRRHAGRQPQARARSPALPVLRCAPAAAT